MSTGAPGRRRADLLTGLLLAGPLVYGLYVVVTLVATARHGFDVTDEGLYLLTARNPRAAYRTFTGAHFLIAPVFSLLGHRVALLRLAKLVVVLLTGAGLGAAVLRWSTDAVRKGRDGGDGGDGVVGTAAAGPSWRHPYVAATAVGALMIYAWTPATPSYNDLSVLFATAAMALALLVIVEPARRRWPLLLGAAHAWHLVTKWPAALLVGAIVWALVIVAVRAWRPFLRLVGLTLAGMAAATVVTQVVLADVGRLLSGIYESTRAVSASSNDPGKLQRIYRDDLRDLGTVLVTRWWWIVPAAVAIGVAERLWGRIAAAALAVVALAGLVVELAAAHVVTVAPGRIVHLRQALPICLAFALAVPVVELVASGRRPRPDAAAGDRHRRLVTVAVVVALVLVPLAQAFGTGNSITFVATMAGAPWVAVLLVAALRRRTDRLSTRILAVGAIGVSAVLVGAIALDGQRDVPYRAATDAWGQDTAVDGVPALRGLRVDRAEATFLHDLAALYRAQEPRPGQRVYALWSLPGLVFAVGGVSANEGWLAFTAPERAADAIASACRTDARLQAGDRPFLLVSGDDVPTVVADAVGTCGAPFPACYREAGRLTMPQPDHNRGPLALWVPARGTAGC